MKEKGMERKNFINTIIFDWGDTVMRDFPEYQGAMVDWPRVEALPGIPAVLPALAGEYRLALATNAAVSRSEQVRLALQRVNLDSYFSKIFTASELGLNKQDPGYYPRVIEALACRPDQALMVGDGYETDIAHAKAAGLRAAWYNPKVIPCPRPHPLHDLELRAMEDLPRALNSPWLPDLQACLKMLHAQQAGPALEAHSLAVASMAHCIAGLLQQQGVWVNVLQVHRAALLHDLDKVTARQNNRSHGSLAVEILCELGYASLADMVERHVVHHILDPKSAPRTWEEKVVYYADKLVDGARFVGVKARLFGLIQRYPASAGQIESCLPLVLALEDEILQQSKMLKANLYAFLTQHIEKSLFY
jgi:putative hydrolase of the HAD superfamily